MRIEGLKPWSVPYLFLSPICFTLDYRHWKDYLLMQMDWEFPIGVGVRWK